MPEALHSFVNASASNETGIMANPRFTPDQEMIRMVRAAEDAWNLRDVDAILFSHRIDCLWRERTEFLWGREQVRAFLFRKWRQEGDFRVVKEYWASSGPRIAIRIVCEFRNDSGVWYRALGSESWEHDGAGLIARHLSCVNEHQIEERERLLKWPIGARPADFPSLTELGL